MSHAVLGGTEIGDDLGYGAARYFAPLDVVATANALAAPALEGQMRARFDPVVMQRLGIYPGGWSSAELGWLMDEYRNLRKFFDGAGSRGSAVFTCIV